MLGYMSFSRNLDHLVTITGGKTECLAIDPCKWVKGDTWELSSDDFYFFIAHENEGGGKCYSCFRQEKMWNCHVDERESPGEDGRVARQHQGPGRDRALPAK